MEALDKLAESKYLLEFITIFIIFMVFCREIGELLGVIAILLYIANAKYEILSKIKDNKNLKPQ